MLVPEATSRPAVAGVGGKREEATRKQGRVLSRILEAALPCEHLVIRPFTPTTVKQYIYVFSYDPIVALLSEQYFYN